MPSIRTNIHIMPAFGHIFFTTSHNLGFFYCQRFSLHRGATKTFSQNEVISNFRDNQNLNCWHLVELQKQIFFRENTRTNISVTSLILAIPRYALPVVVLAVEDAWLTKKLLVCPFYGAVAAPRNSKIFFSWNRLCFRRYFLGFQKILKEHNEHFESTCWAESTYSIRIVQIHFKG